MHETTEKVLKSMLEGSPWEDVADGGEDSSYFGGEKVDAGRIQEATI